MNKYSTFWCPFGFKQYIFLLCNLDCTFVSFAGLYMVMFTTYPYFQLCWKHIVRGKGWERNWMPITLKVRNVFAYFLHQLFKYSMRESLTDFFLTTHIFHRDHLACLENNKLATFPCRKIRLNTNVLFLQYLKFPHPSM